jgi:hypothetical protein
MLFETSGSNEAHDQEKLEQFLKKAMDKSLVIDGITLNEPGKMRSVWVIKFLK